MSSIENVIVEDTKAISVEKQLQETVQETVVAAKIANEYDDTDSTCGKIDNSIEPSMNIPKVSNPIKEGTVIKNVENNKSFQSLLVYDSDSNSSSDNDVQLNWREKQNISDESSSSSEDEDELCLNGTSENHGAIKKGNKNSFSQTVLDVSIDELPPVPDMSSLEINVANEEFMLMGHILGIVDKLVTVEAIPNSPAYDLDTILFLESKIPLGPIFDVLGPVTAPIYAIRFNCIENIKQKKLIVGMNVYSAPKSKFTQYVFLQQLLKMKGSDASWIGDSEVPQELEDFSDDEKEHHNKCASRIDFHIKRTREDSEYKKFETTMNKRNLLNTKYNRYLDAYRQTRQNNRRISKAAAAAAAAAAQTKMQSPMPLNFNPNVPPPNVVPPSPVMRNPYSPFLFENTMPTTFLPPEFLASLANNNSNMHFDPIVGDFISFDSRDYRLMDPIFTERPTNTNTQSNLNTGNYVINISANNVDHPGPSHH